MAEEHVEAYRAVRRRTSDLVREVPTDRMEEIAPATPEWRVRDVLAHMVGVCADAVEGRLDGVATDPWTAAQVDARRGVTVGAMLDEWERYGPQFEGALEVIPAVTASQAVFDAITHEQDIRHALGVPGARECDAIGIAFDFAARGRTFFELPAIRVVTDGDEVVSGAGDPVATLATSKFEFMRAVSGRRTAAEIAAYDWEGVVEPDVLIAAPIFTMRAAPLHE
jgi:uncharacterized protein (TIGR03083 family)